VPSASTCGAPESCVTGASLGVCVGVENGVGVAGGEPVCVPVCEPDEPPLGVGVCEPVTVPEPEGEFVRVPEPDGEPDRVFVADGVGERDGVEVPLAAAPGLGVCEFDGVALGVGCTTPMTKNGDPYAAPGVPPVVDQARPPLAVVATAPNVAVP